MNTAISFELAKLLKEKGYNESCGMLYNDNGTISGTKMSMGGHPNNYINKYSAPTIAEVVMWVYEKYRVWISVDPENDTNTWFYTITHNKSETVFGNYSSPTEAYEAAIEYTLNHLI